VDREDNMSTKIIQIVALPAGWLATYQDSTGRPEAYPIPLAGLREDGEIVLLDIDPHGLVTEVRGAANFVSVVPPPHGMTNPPRVGP
jgi:hypothetical protein